MNKVQILGPDGTPYRSARPSMLTGGSRIPYDAADSFSDQLANWQPALWSPDNEINIYRDRIVSRARALVRHLVPLRVFWITLLVLISGLL